MGSKGLLYAKQPRSKPSRSARIKPLLWLLILLPTLGVGYTSVKNYFTQPQAILVLGGAREREDFAAIFARQHPDLPIWVSSGSNPEYTRSVFADAGIDPKRLYIDRTAVDTVTNFTTLVDEFQSKGITSVYLITSDYHMRRSRIIGTIVFGSRGIDIKPVVVESGQTAEALSKGLRDGARAILWVITGHTGSTLSRRDVNR